LDEKTKIIDLEESIELPDGENSVLVTDDDSGALNDGWPKIVLESDIATHPSGRLNSNGTDHCRIRARCRYPNGDVAGMLPRRDTSTPYDERRIRTSYWIINPPRVYVKVGDEQGDEIPVAGWSEREIETSVDMERVPHFVVYDGCETVGFSVDQLAGIAPAEVPVVYDYAETVLTARAEGGGYATVTGTWMGQSATLIIIIADPGIGSITARADPASIDLITPSQIVACVLTPDGLPVADGTVVTAEIFSGPGSLQSGSALTTTETIEAEEQWSSDEITVGVANAISEVISVIIDRTASFLKNYYTGGSFDGKTITLGTSLPDRVSLVYVTYRAGGCAAFTFRSQTPGKTVILCDAGQENCKVEITTSIKTESTSTPADAASPDTTPAGHSITYGAWQTLHREGSWGPPLASDANPDLHIRDNYLHRGPVEYEVVGRRNCVVEVNGVTGEYLVIVYGAYELVELPYWGADGYVRGTLRVLGKKADGSIVPVGGWDGQIHWSAWGDIAAVDEDVEDIDGDSRARYVRGRPGSHSVTVSFAGGWPVPQTKSFTIDDGTIDRTGDPTRKVYKTIEYEFEIHWRPIYE
jgi:hypothetical protein